MRKNYYALRAAREIISARALNRSVSLVESPNRGASKVCPSSSPRGFSMKFSLVLVATLALASAAFAAEDGAAIYKTKCAACHGAEGQGKMGPALKGTALTEDQIVTVLTMGAEGKKAPHGKPVSGLSKEEAAAVAAYVKTLK